MDFLNLFNQVARFAKPAHSDFTPIDSLGTPFTETELDSMDMLIVAMYFSEIYGISDEDSKSLMPMTIGEMQELIDKLKTKTPESIEVAMGSIK